MSTLPKVFVDRHELYSAVQAARRAGQRVGLIPTMGALHEGHLSLVDACRAECDLTIVTIFVNPAQFAPGEDLEKYPRDLQRDLELVGSRGADWVFAPAVSEMYRPGHGTYVQPGAVSQGFEGAIRPSHFRGVATIVLKLFQIVPAEIAFFGQKDYQQTLVVRQMVSDFDLPIEVRVCPIVREADGLAMSSRNVYLTAEHRAQARSISASLRRAQELFDQGERRAPQIRLAVVEQLEQAGLQVQYVELVREGTLTPVDQIDAPCVILVAVQAGQTRLIDNWIIGYKAAS